MTKKELQFALTHGGVLKDSKGKWMMHGDKVRCKDRYGNERTGCVLFDIDAGSWYVDDSENGEWLSLGDCCGEITYIEKV